MQSGVGSKNSWGNLFQIPAGAFRGSAARARSFARRFGTGLAASFLALFITACLTDNFGSEDVDQGAPTGGSATGQYWKRSDGIATWVHLQGSTARMCSGNQITTGTYNASEPSMTFVISGNVLKIPLRFEGNSLLVGVPGQAVNTHDAVWYVKSTTWGCGGGGTGGTGGTGGSTMGRITFYTSVRDGGSITIRLFGSTIGTLTQYFSSGAPSCTQSSGVVSVERAPGTYSFTASDEDGNTWSGSVTSIAGGCTLMHLRL